MRRSHPDAPWLWNESWARRRIPGRARGRMWLWWGIAAFVTAASVPLIWRIPAEVAERGEPLRYLGLIFPVASVWLLARAVQETRRFVGRLRR